MTRADRIHENLTGLQSLGIVTDWYCQTQMPGRRWVVWGPGFPERSMTTRECERFISRKIASGIARGTLSAT